ncbi:zinc ribbon domain-containing protein, partial [Paenibacillus tyrfis]|uniref:zinc ribbon domain-containing protein n=1 Tax=Paenibacillus tyrfis TaxID=1501230 RepID=UPI0020A1E7A4
ESTYLMKHSFTMMPTDSWVKPTEQVKSLVIVPEHIWDKVQQIRIGRNPENTNDPNVEKIKVTKSPLLFVGMINCGYCGAPLTTTYNRKKYTLADGTEQKWVSAKYRCSGKALTKTKCTGQTVYAPNKIETTVMSELQYYLNELRTVDLSKEIDKYYKENLLRENNELELKQKEIEKYYTELSALKNEITKSIMGESAFKPEILNDLIEKKEEQISLLSEKIRQIQSNIKDNSIELHTIEELKNNLPKWKTVFDEASIERKKMMLKSLIDNIVVFRDGIELNIKLNIKSFLSSANGSVIESLGRAHRWQR